MERVAAALPGPLPRALKVAAARRAVDAARSGLAAGAEPDAAAVVAAARADVDAVAAHLLRPVLNGTGVLLHTNLGRAPLPAGAAAAAGAVAGASNLELDLDTGRRGSRHHAAALLAAAVGAEAGLIVNNGAAAVLLALAALARGREVIVSRGELVEIGGSFRIPDVLRESGAVLREVGTTNRTRAADYRAALSDQTALLLKVHPSNYRVVGFTEEATVAELATLGGPPVVVDAGSGLLDAAVPWLPERPAWLDGELGVRQALEDGAGLVTCSGDKLLGGPQAGIVVGRVELVEPLARHPLARALRVDVGTLAALQHVALAYLDGTAGDLPLWRVATATPEALRARAADVAAAVPGAEVVDTVAVAGGGSLPGRDIPSAGVALDPPPAADELVRRLRHAGVVPRVADGRVVVDLRTIDPADDGRLVAALLAARRA